MAKFRQYKNGIFGHRYKGYYITRNNDNHFRRGKLYKIIDGDGNMILDETPDYDDCEWYIDRMTASSQEMEVYRTLYSCEIPKLQRMGMKYSLKSEKGTITKEEKVLYKMILKIRDRKIGDKEFDQPAGPEEAETQSVV